MRSPGAIQWRRRVARLPARGGMLLLAAACWGVLASPAATAERGTSSPRPWAFEPPCRPAFPPVSRPAWRRNAVDAFVLARLEREGLEPSPVAERRRLIRRLYLDLLGLPPEPEEADEFAADTAPDAFERLVDRVLASPAFGERMAWSWLDAARYADSNGYQGDRERTMWPWRDWVVDAFNRNLPYDRFTVWQVAGDLLPGATFEQRLATGFCRNHMINGEGGRIPEENRVDYVMDMSETVGTVWLGLTMNCCRCHDHKFDPLTRRDYYGLFAFFNQTEVTGAGGDPQTPPVLEVPSDEQRRELARLEVEVDAAATALEEKARAAARSPAASGAGDASAAEPPPQAAVPGEIRRILERPVRERSAGQLEKLEKHWRDSRPELAAAAERLRRARGRLDALRRSFPRVMVMADMKKRRRTFMLEKGLYNRRGEEVTAATPASLPAMPPPAPRNRLGLARWLVAPRNPLTARVAVNRFWQEIFGTGIVKTAGDFGTQGEAPSNRALLDWLAVELRESGWDIKGLCRLVVTSATYRQSSRATRRKLERDPANRLLARGARFRMPSWMLRDQALAASGLLVERCGGPPVFPYQPAGVWAEATFGKKRYRQDHGEKLYRRSLYTFWRRIVGPTVFFDSASRQTCTVNQSRTNTPLHALTTLNDVTYMEAARVLAARVIGETRGAGPRRRIERAFRRVLVRLPSDEELDVLVAGFERARRLYAADPEAARELLSVGESAAVLASAPAPDVAAAAALAAVCNAILNLDETLTRE